MATFTIDKYGKEMARKGRALKTAAGRSAFKAAKFLEIMARAGAPGLTGQTRMGISVPKKVGPRSYLVESRVPGKHGKGGVFYQNMWANHTGRFAAPVMVWNRRAFTPYGTGKANYTGNKLGFFNVAVLAARKEYPRIAITHVRNTLRAKIN